MADQLTGKLSPFLRRRRLAAVRPYFGPGRNLDYGCGVGELATFLPPEGYLGVDIDAESVVIAGGRYPSHRFATIEELEDSDEGGFERVFALALIEHLPNPAGWLKDLRRRVVVGAKLIVTTPEPRLQWAHDLGGRLGIFSRQGAEEHQSLMNRRRLVALSQGTGWALVRFRRFLCGANQLFELRALSSEDREAG
ncbi:MAG: class I SAM-dependent methyltransferase [Acidobacteriota bacterium]